ncbi:MAG: outer membrane beta-barrel protein [Chitinivibrionales bacterium]
MNSIRLTVCISLCAFALVFQTQPCQAEPEHPFSLSVLLGMGYNTISSDNDLHYFFAPTSEVRPNIGYNWALETDFKLSSFFSLVTGLDYEAKKGQYTSETQVQFSGDPAVHDFKSNIDLYYLSIPINFKIGYTFRNQWANIRLGPVISVLMEQENAWYIDNQNAEATGYYYSSDGSTQAVPGVAISGSDLSFLAGAEYGYRLGINGFFVACNYEYGLRNIVTAGPSGQAYNRSIVLFLGYRRFF